MPNAIVSGRSHWSGGSVSSLDHEVLSAELNPGLPVYVLMDPLGGEPWPPQPGADLNEQRKEAWGCDVHTLALDPSIKLAASAAPYLLGPLSVNSPVMAQSWELAHTDRSAWLSGGVAQAGAHPWRVGGWLQSHAEPDVLAAHLAGLMRLHLLPPLSSTARYLRLADPRVLHLIHQLCGQAFWQRLYPIQQWHYVAPSGELLGAKLLQGKHGAPLPLPLQRAQWQVLQWASVLNQALARSADGARPAWPHHDEQVLALELGLRWLKDNPQRPAREPDQVAAATLFLRHLNWPQDPRIQATLSAQPTKPLHQLVLTLDAALSASHT